MFTNQKKVYDDLLNVIKPFSSIKIITLFGKTGIGKSFVIETLMNELQCNYSSPIFYIKGDQFCQDRDYYCIRQALNEITVSYEKRKGIKEVVSKGFENIPYVGSVVTKLVSNKLYQKEIKQKQKNYILDDEEQDIIYRLNYLFDKRSSLIICDNIQFFDKKSLELLYLLISSNDTAFEFFSKCQFLVVYTETDGEQQPIIKQIFCKKSNEKIHMLPIEYDEMDSVLSKFGCKSNLDEEIKKVLFKLSEGHLAIIKQVVSQINDTLPNKTMRLNADSSDSLLEELISIKLRNLGASGEQISKVLEYASLIGKTFSNEELSRVVELNKQDFYNAIQQSNEMDFIASHEKYSIFSHDIIQLLFKKRANKNYICYYERIRECVKELTPSEYGHRIEIEQKLGNLEEAAILIVLLCAKRNYELRDMDESHQQILRLYPEIRVFLQDMHRAYEEYKERNYQKTISILNTIDDLLPVELLAEKDLLKSISLTKLLSENYRQDAIRCLEHYTLAQLNNEGDLYLRVQLALISSYSHMAEIDKAQKCEKEIFMYLQPRIGFDENARTLVNVLRRKANSMHECICAEVYIKKSVQYFEPLPGQCAPLNPIQYLMSLGNYAGILIECGRFADSYSEIVKAQDLVKENENIVFPRTQIIDNNYLLGVYLMNNQLKSEVMKAYKKLVDISQNADNIFITSNYCALLSVNGYVDDAYALLEAKQSMLQNNSEPFYEICINNNLLVLNLFNKEFDKAQALLDELYLHIDNIIDESYYKKKYELFQYVISEKVDIPIEKIDTFLFDLCENFQDAWAYWGRSFDYTPLYYWSDM